MSVWVLWIVVVAAVLIGVVLLALGRGEGLVEDPPDDVLLDLPAEKELTSSDVTNIRLPMAIRGYRMAEVDDVLDRLAAELAVRDTRIRELERGFGRRSNTEPSGE